MIRLILFFVIPTFTLLAKPCPPQGDSKEKNVRALDLLKNRPVGPQTAGFIDPEITLERILDPGDDTNRFQPSHGATITGYIVLVKDGGLETCNCHSKTNRDTHIVLVRALGDANKPHRHVIVEVTPHFRKQFGTTEQLRKRLLGKQVTFAGWMFFDEEHKQNAFNTNPRGTNIWRATCWEIHPVTSIKVDSQARIDGAEAALAEMERLKQEGLRQASMQHTAHLIFHPWEILP